MTRNAFAPLRTTHKSGRMNNLPASRPQATILAKQSLTASRDNKLTTRRQRYAPSPTGSVYFSPCAFGADFSPLKHATRAGVCACAALPVCAGLVGARDQPNRSAPKSVESARLCVQSSRGSIGRRVGRLSWQASERAASKRVSEIE